MNQTVEIDNGDSELAKRVHVYTVVRTQYDHFLNFGGLSGTMVKNDRGEVIGEHTGSIHGLTENRKVYVSPIEFALKDIKDLVDNYQPR